MKRPSLPSFSAETKTAIRKFLTRLFAFIGVFLTLVLLLAFWGLHAWLFPNDAQPETPKEMILSIDFTNPIVEKPRDFELSLPALLQEEPETPLFLIVRALNEAKNDPRVKGVVAYFGSSGGPSLVQMQEVSSALARFKESGKPAYSFAQSYGSFSGGRALVALATHFDHIWLQPVGIVGLTGLGIEAPFAKSALENIGVKANFLRREEYKSAMENVSQDSFSPAVRENMERLMESLHEQVAEALAQGRKIEKPKAMAFLANGPYTASEAIKMGLVTKIGYEDEMNKEIDEKLGKDIAKVDPQTYLYYVGKDSKIETKADVALIYAEGVLTDQPRKGPYRLAGDDEKIDADAVAQAFDDAVKNEKIRAILFRVNSPGGSPVASESIRRALVKAKEAKIPVFVSVGAVAASGGYWIIMDADHIVANPASVTGSIGVVGGKFVLEGLYDKIGLKWERLGTSDNAHLFSTRSAFDAKGEERINAMLDEVYQAFTSGVSAARKIPLEKMPDIAKGRVFTGKQALDAKLVDELGGMETAVAAVKKRLNLEPSDKISLWRYPEPETPQTILLRAVENMRFGSLFLSSLGGGAPSLRFLERLENATARLAPLWDELEEADQGGVRAILPAPFPRKGW